MSIFSNWNKYPLSYRLLLYVVLCTSFFTLLSTSTQLYSEYKRDISSIYQSIDFIEESYLQAITASVYKVDEEQLRIILQGVLMHQDIKYLLVKEIRGGKEFRYYAGNPDEAKDIVKIFPLEYINPSGIKKSIGALTVMATLEEVYNRLTSRIITVCHN